VFTENRNAEDSNEECLVHCLSGSIIKDGTAITSDDLPASTFENAEELATVESGLVLRLKFLQKIWIY